MTSTQHLAKCLSLLQLSRRITKLISGRVTTVVLSIVDEVAKFHALSVILNPLVAKVAVLCSEVSIHIYLLYL